MANNNKSIINSLQELLIKEGYVPTYNFLEKKGISKKEAKQNAAKNMLSLLAKNKEISLSGDTLSSSSVVNIKQSSAKVYKTPPSCKQSTTVCNYIGMLQEFCQQQKIEGGPPHLKTFTIRVSVGSLQESGTALGKKFAKQEAAKSCWCV